MAQNLAEIQPNSIPVNFLTPIKGTPFEDYEDKTKEELIDILNEEENKED